MDPNSSSKTGKEEKKTEELKIMEWRFNQFLGEKLSIEEIKNNPDNESFLVTGVNFSPDGLYSMVSDKGGRIIIFRKITSNKKNPKLTYHYEYAAHEKEFDRHKSCEYSEGVRAFSVLENQNINNIDILSAGYRNIKLDRVYNSKSTVYDTDSGILNPSVITVPKVKEMNYEVKHKTRAEFKAHNSEIKSISENKLYSNNFISSDEFKVFLWDMNTTKEVFNPVDLEPGVLDVCLFFMI